MWKVYNNCAWNISLLKSILIGYDYGSIYIEACRKILENLSCLLMDIYKLGKEGLKILTNLQELVPITNVGKH
jgi:hypothetical protein